MSNLLTRNGEKMNDIDRFSFFKSYLEGIEKLKFEENKKEMTWAIVNYIYYNKNPIWSRKESEKKELIWTLIVPSLDKSKKVSCNAKSKSN